MPKTGGWACIPLFSYFRPPKFVISFRPFGFNSKRCFVIFRCCISRKSFLSSCLFSFHQLFLFKWPKFLIRCISFPEGAMVIRLQLLLQRSSSLPPHLLGALNAVPRWNMRQGPVNTWIWKRPKILPKCRIFCISLIYTNSGLNQHTMQRDIPSVLQ